MKRMYVIVAAMLLVGLSLYMSLGGYSLINNRKRGYAKSVITGREGELLPSISILLSDSITKINLSSIPNGKPTVLFYFSPYCPYCQSEMDTIINNITRLKHIQFYLVTPYSHREMKLFYNKNHLERYENIIVGLDYDIRFSEYFRIVQVPFIAIYDKGKRLNAGFFGGVASDQLRQVSQE
ncbi:TlpA family protein disulfide reductase [Chitinophaga sp. RCC_12]|uniref:TlpA family protein disulfide reductase n=1 Tax=Chitinophaga sp. RCC_12 TaxID=3239226 RepID=UPI0035233370